jgi:hypothetical protein
VKRAKTFDPSPLPAALVRWCSLCQQDNVNVRMAAAIFSLSLHPLAKQTSAKKLPTPRSLPERGGTDESHSIAIAGCHRSDRGDI